MLAPVLLFGFKCLHSGRVVLSRANEPYLGSSMHLICTKSSTPPTVGTKDEPHLQAAFRPTSRNRASPKRRSTPTWLTSSTAAW